MHKRKITHRECGHAARDVATSIWSTQILQGRSVSEMSVSEPRIKLYGIPRGGIPSAYLVKSALQQWFQYTARIVEDPQEADIFIDDLVDSGKTRDEYQRRYPKSFYTLFEKPQEDTDWYVFPWEVGDAGEESAADIPLRLLQYIGEDPQRGGLLETPTRFLSAWSHWTSGYGVKPEDVLKTFKDGAEDCDELILQRNIPVYSQCEHHMAPFFGVAHIGYIPNGRIVGLSKMSRLVEVFARRLQVQERLTNQIADAMQTHLDPVGVGVVLECRHMCMESRGICQLGTSTVTSALRGAMKDEPETRSEFMRLLP